jgi:hypothetical protein
MAKKNRGNKNRKPIPANQPLPNQVVINDFGIDVRYVDNTRKDLSSWRTAYQSATDILNPVRKPMYDLYTDICLDEHLTSVMGQRRRAVTNTTITFLNNGNPVDSINDIVKTEGFLLLVKHALDTRFHGFSLVHCDFRNDITELVPRAHVKPLQRIVVKDPYDMNGIDYSQGIYKAYYAPIGEADDLGLLIIAAVLVILKRGNTSDWAQFNEMFGMPMRKGTYDANMPNVKEQLLKALEMSGALSYIAVPSGSNVEFIEANKSGASDTYDKFYDRMEKGLSKLIVGQTMTTEDGSSRSQGEVHERVAEGIHMDDRLFITRLLNGRIRDMLIQQGFSDAANGEFQFIDEEATITKRDRLDMDLLLHEKVAPIKTEYFETEYNVEFDEKEMAARKKSAEQAQQQPKPEKPDPKEPEKTKLALALYERFMSFFV